MFLYSCSTFGNGNSEYNILKTRMDTLVTEVRINSINIQNNTLRINGVEAKIAKIRKRLAKEREQDNFANKIPPISEIIDGDNQTNNTNRRKNIDETSSIIKVKKHLAVPVKYVKKSMNVVAIDDNNTFSKNSSIKQKRKVTNYKQYYKNALATYMARNYEKAKSMFELFISRYHNNNLVDNAIFWLAHSYLHIGQTKKAVKEFKILVKNYPFNALSTGGKTDAALYDLIKIYSHNKAKSDYYKKILFERFPMSKYTKMVRKIEGG